ncbi:MAG: dihydroorotase [Candidatus Marinimicrobia bacterium]|nr:dihydroorotase [Candidatus Neomarinimicrobiota bacterium]
MDAIQIINGRLLCPVTGLDTRDALWVYEGCIQGGSPPPGGPVRTLDAGGRYIFPGFIDLHVHLREPGLEEAETVASGARAALAGGFTAVVAMPNTTPPLDTPERVAACRAAGRAAGGARVWPSACLTRGRAGQEAADLAGLAAAGAVAFTDDGATVPDTELLRALLVAARKLGRPVMDHAQDPRAEKNGVVHAGPWAARHGLPGIPREAEVDIIARDLDLAAATGGWMHIQHITTAGGVERLRAARAQGLSVSGEVTPHHLLLCDEDCDPDDANFKMNPPLREASDRSALQAGILEGVISCLATDHAPHLAATKARGLRAAPFGVVGLETAVGLTYSLLVRDRGLALGEWVARWTSGPAAVLGRPAPTLAPGQPADLTLFDPDAHWTVNPDEFISKARNTPFAGRLLQGRAQGLCLGELT